jgi:hypothetical protein
MRQLKGGSMKFRMLRVQILANDNQNYGYEVEFKSGLNIVRGDNSSGKSTFVNSLLYSLGMEEIIGAKGVASLPYALKSSFEFEDGNKTVVSSTVCVEIENHLGNIVTFKRAIESTSDNTKLIQVINGPYLTTSASDAFTTKPTFLHDSGSAQDPERGFFAFFEKFLGLEMPSISDNKGKTTKLYLQSVFAALIVEQKRGWTDYIANIPYYSVSGMREKVASFLLDLNVFRNAKQLNDFTSQRNKVVSEWSEIVTSIKLLADTHRLSVTGLNKLPTVEFDRKLVFIGEQTENETKTLGNLRADIIFAKLAQELQSKVQLYNEAPELVEKIEEIQNRIDELLILQSMSGSQVNINEAQLKQYEISLEGIESDLKANKLTKKLSDFGANVADLKVAKGICGTCMTPIDDILMPPDSGSIPMSIAENIVHLENQKKMTKALIEGLSKNIERDKNQLHTIKIDIVKFRQELMSHKRDIKSINEVKESDVRVKIDLENRQSSITLLEEKSDKYLSRLELLSSQFKGLTSEISKLSKSTLSSSDWKKVSAFESNFKQLATNFGYRSATVSNIKVESETMLPYLGGIELRGNLDTPSEAIQLNSSDIKSDSSASDFVRLIWAYLISFQQTSLAHRGNHPNFILFDEPAQHSMSEKSVNSLFNQLDKLPEMQSIIAASFDESDDNFEASTKGLKSYHLIRLPRKIIGSLHNTQ